MESPFATSQMTRLIESITTSSSNSAQISAQSVWTRSAPCLLTSIPQRLFPTHICNALRRSTTLLRGGRNRVATEFVDSITLLLASDTPLTHIVNLDETMVRWYPIVLQTWEKRGADAVHVRADTTEKIGLTATCMISAAGRSFDPVFLKPMGRADPAIPGLTIMSSGKKGWMTSSCMCHGLRHLREQIHLVLDQAPSHRAAIVAKEARKLRIKLYFIFTPAP